MLMNFNLLSHTICLSIVSSSCENEQNNYLLSVIHLELR